MHHNRSRATVKSDGWKVVSLCAVLMTALAGCSEAVIKQYTELGKWSAPTDTPTVISGSADADQAAYDAAGQDLSAADWKVLESIAPRPIWERLDKARRTYHERESRQPAETELAQVTTRPSPVEVLQDLPITELPNGKLRIYYNLQHYGGSTASSTVDGGTERRKISLHPVDMNPLVGLLNKELDGKGSCTALPSENALVITCQADARQQVLQLLADVDRQPPQVEITARIFEVQHDFDFQLGAHTLLRHMANDNTQAMASRFSTRAFLDALESGAGPMGFQGSALRLMQTFGDSGISLEATFQALADTGLIREVASPRMTVLVGRTGYMMAGQELPIQSARFQSDQILTEKTTYKPVGVQLYITPQTIAADQVKLHVLTVVSAVSGFSPRMSMDGSDQLQTLINPIFDSREAETSVTVPDGNTLVIGGLRMVRHITRERKIPGLGDLPLVEWLFKNHRSQRQLNDLYFFVTPRIIRD